MARAMYQRRIVSGTARAELDTDGFAATLRDAVAGLARLPDAAARDRIAGKLGDVIFGLGEHGAFFTFPGFGGGRVLAWGGRTDQALKALAAGDAARAEADLDGLLVLAGRAPTGGRALAPEIRAALRHGVALRDAPAALLRANGDALRDGPSGLLRANGDSENMAASSRDREDDDATGPGAGS
jgi:hypothetical protein